MQTEYSLTSIGKPGEFFVGALLRDFIEQWNRSPLNREVTGTDWTFDWQQESPGAKFSHRVLLTTAGVPQDTKAALLLTIGHLILSRMPEEGLTEALEGLAETYNFWTSWKVNTLTSSPVSRFFEATQGSTYERPKFHVTED